MTSTNYFDMKGTKGGARRGAGRPVTTGKGTQVNARIHAHDLAAIDEWAARHGCTRAAALVRLAKLGLLADKKDDSER